MSSAKKKTSGPVSQRTDSPYKIVRNVTMPSLKLEIEKPYFVKVTGPYFTGKAQKPGKDGKAMEPATVLPIVNLETGEVAQLVMGAVLKGILDDSYPDDVYVGRAFRLVKHDKANGKRYFSYSVDEIEA
jgi:hypothetical protein